MTDVANLRKMLESAFEAVFRLFHENLYFYFFKHTRDQYPGEELVQIIVLKPWQFRTYLTIQSGIAERLLRIAKTSIIDVFRKLVSEFSIDLATKTGNKRVQPLNKPAGINELSCNQTPLPGVLDHLVERFATKINFYTQLIQSIRITANFKKKHNLKTILEIICALNKLSLTNELNITHMSRI